MKYGLTFSQLRFIMNSLIIQPPYLRAKGRNVVICPIFWLIFGRFEEMYIQY